MDSGFNTEDLKNVKHISALSKVCGVVVVMILTYSNTVSWGLGIATASQLGITGLMSWYSSTELDLGQHFSKFTFAISPIWALYLDPCSLGLVIWMTAASATLISTELKNNAHRIIYAGLTILSWLFVLTFQDETLGACGHSLSYTLKRDILITIVFFTFNLVTLSKYADASLRSTKASLIEVKELNFKFAELNNELKQLLDEKDNFILLFSHETRNPLNILIGNLSLLLDEAETPAVKNKLIRCRFCADLLLQHLNNILDSGKLSNNGALEVSPTPVRLYEFVQSTQSFMEMLVKKKGKITPQLLIPQRLPTTLEFDSQRLTQVILNLLTNAVKFTDSGTISMVVRYLRKPEVKEFDYLPSTSNGFSMLESTVLGNVEEEVESMSEFRQNPYGSENQNSVEFQRKITTARGNKRGFYESTKQEKGFLKIEIGDTGCGMSTKELSKLFQKFSQTHTDRSYRKIGTGLGLWITKNLCELMHGGIRVYSKPRMGTIFVAIIQANSIPSAQALMPKLSLNATNPRRNKHERRILIADDDPYNIDFHVQIAKTLGYNTIETAVDGKMLVELFKASPEGYFEVIMTDICMPSINGIEAIQLIREFEQHQRRNQRVKVGIVTGHSNQKDQNICLKSPLNAIFYLSKPINASMLEGFVQPEFLKITSPIELGRLNKCIEQKSRILCVDDDLFNLDCMEDILNSLGAEVTKVQSGEEAVMKVREEVLKENRHFNIILMDCRMPGIDGWTAAAQIKEILQMSDLQDIPIIGVTGDDPKRNEGKLGPAGMVDLIQKPISRDRLHKLLKKYI